MLPVNKNELQTPGVYINEIASLPPSVISVPTAIPAFIGYTEIATDAQGNNLNLKPALISSLVEYELLFGKAPKETSLMATIIEHHDINGHIISTDVSAAIAGTPSTKYMMYYAVQMFFLNGGNACYIVSVDIYTTGNGEVVTTQLQNGLNATETENEPSLIVFTDGLNIANTSDYYTLQNNALALCAKTKSKFLLIDVYDNTGDTGTNAANFRNGIGTENLTYGAAYYPNLLTTLSYAYDDNSVTLTVSDSEGGTPLLTSANLGELFSENKNVYDQVTFALKQVGVTIPPASAIAGIMATVDASRGVWKAPANVSLNCVAGLSDNISDASGNNLNVDISGKSINAIRNFTGKGILVWGARTLDGNDNEFRYVPVRRFFIMVEVSLKNAIEQFVFEPNDANTWIRIKAMIENYLINLWKLGALAGAKPQEAYFVNTGLGQTMTLEDIANGNLIIETGMAPLRAAEFIIITFSQIQQAL